jgi:hypothetical protein
MPNIGHKMHPKQLTITATRYSYKNQTLCVAYPMCARLVKWITLNRIIGEIVAPLCIHMCLCR